MVIEILKIILLLGALTLTLILDISAAKKQNRLRKKRKGITK